MPTLVAMLVASLAGWLVDGLVDDMLGPVSSMAVGLLVSTVAFFFAKQYFTDLRGGS